jgi:hypothetical protein
VARATRKSTARSTAPRKAAGTRSTSSTPRKAAPRRAVPAAETVVATDITVEVEAPPAGTTDLAGGLRTYLGAIDAEVRAVSALSTRIDALVNELNDLRDQQAKRLIVLDELRASVTDSTLGSFLDQAIKPRKTRVREVIPERLA